MAARLIGLLLGLGLWLLSSPAFAFDTWWHAEETRHAMVANGFSGDARLVAQFTNYLIDFYSVAADRISGFEGVFSRLPGGRPPNAPSTARLDPADVDRLHFDSLFSTDEIEAQWRALEANTRAALRKYAADQSVKPGFRPIVLLTVIGASLHVVQDFYSHSNWVNEHIKKAPGSPVPIWYDVPPARRAAMQLFTGAYPNGCCPGHIDHEKLGKDSSDQGLNEEAVDAATRASVAWAKMLMQDPSIPWETLKAYKVSDVAGRRFLYTLDATFLTSSSIIAGHFDGPQPHKKIFNSDPAREKRMALQALLGVLGGYATNLVLRDNLYKLPSPYWAGLLVYHVERDLAKGLLLAGRRR